MVIHDDYMTPFSAWEDVSAYTPRHLTLWEAFYGDGTSGHHLAQLGFDVIHEDVDFFEHDLGECVVTNPPFSELPRILARLRELGMPCSTLTTRSQTSRLSSLGGASSSGSWSTAWRCRAGGAASTACIFVGDSGCRGTWCSWGDGRFYPPVENETRMTR